MLARYVLWFCGAAVEILFVAVFSSFCLKQSTHRRHAVFLALWLMLAAGNALRGSIEFGVPLIVRGLQCREAYVMHVLYAIGSAIILFGSAAITLIWLRGPDSSPAVTLSPDDDLKTRVLGTSAFASSIASSTMWLIEYAIARCVRDAERDGRTQSVRSASQHWRSCDVERSPSKLRVRSFVLSGGTSKSVYDSRCVICLGDLSEGCEVGMLPCGHVFHNSCIQVWLKSGRSAARCPMRCPIAANKLTPRSR